MSYQVIARKWRPQTFEEVTGQEAITRTLRNALEHDRLHHAYLFSGARGVGKTTTARLLAKALNCHKTTKPNAQPCSFNDPAACVSCREISESRSIDVLEFDAASHTKVEEIRDIILESININPARDRYKIFIIDEVHMLSTSSFNALLKTLEEPPERVEFIMATTELHKVPDTILSRCQEFEFRTIAVSKIFERLRLIADAEKINVSDEALKEIARSGEGSMRDAQSNFDQVISFSGERIETADVTSALGLASAEMLTRITQAIAANEPKQALLVVDELISRGQDLRNFARDLLAFFRDLLVFKMANDAENLLDTAILSRSEMEENAAPFSESDLIRFFNSLSETETKLKEATQSRYVLEIGLVKLIEMRRVAPIEKILERLAKLESALTGADYTPNVAAEKKVSRTIEPSPTEKKTLKVDFPADEVPFAIGETQISRFSGANDSISEFRAKERKIAEPAEFADSTSNDKESAPSVEKNEVRVSVIAEPPPSAQTEVVRSSNFEEPPEFNESFETAAKFSPIDAEFLDNIAVKLPAIDAAELEHVEDKWLDEAFENKLARLGDKLYPLKNAGQIVAVLLEHSFSNGKSEMTEENPAAAAPTNGRTKTTFEMPTFEEDDESDVIPELPENASQEELLAYAHSHPLVRKAMRVFRAKIEEVKRI